MSTHKRPKIKGKSAYELWRLSQRNYKRAEQDLTAFKRTGRKTDYRYYEMHRKRGQRYAKRLSEKLEQRVRKKELAAIRKHPEFERERKRRRLLRTKFQRTIKYEEGGVTKKRTVTYKFKGKDAVAAFKEQLQRGFVPIPKGDDAVLILDDAEDWELRRMVAMFRAEGS